LIAHAASVETPGMTSDLVVLLHSGGMSSRQWRRTIEALRGKWEVLAPDFLGSGDNPPWPDDAPFHYAMDVQGIEKLLAGRRAHLVGHSYGGLVALTLARTRPELAASVAVYDPVAFGVVPDAKDEEGLANIASVESVPLFSDDARGGSDAWMEAFVDYWNGPGYWRTLPEPTRAGFLRIGKKVYREVRSLMADRTTLAEMAQVRARTLLVGGEKSPAAARRVVALLAGALPDARAVTIEGAGHMGPLTHAARFNELLVAHLAASG
jgi:pimeloyl-ACP methyl ester carboxylesterase